MGSRFRSTDHKRFSLATDVKVYFCDPHQPSLPNALRRSVESATRVVEESYTPRDNAEANALFPNGGTFLAFDRGHMRSNGYELRAAKGEPMRLPSIRTEHPANIARTAARIAAVTMLSWLPTVASAIPVTLNFTADFATGPIDSVTGSFGWEAASLSDPIESLTSIDLTINGYTYSLSEIGFSNDSTRSHIGGLKNTIYTIVGDAAGLPDFFIDFDRVTSTPDYALFGLDPFTFVGINWFSSGGSFPVFEITPTTSAPEPGTLALFGLGLAGLGFARRRRTTN